MGPLLLTGLATLGATIALGLIGSNAVPSARPGIPPPNVRSFAVILMAFASGIGVIGVVVGTLAVVTGVVGDSSPVLAVVLAPAILGTLIGFAMIIRAGGAVDRSLSTIAISFIAGQAILAGVVATLAVTIREFGGPSPAAPPFVVFGITAAAGAIGLGVVGGRGLHAVAAADARSTRQAVSDQIRRVVPFDAIAVGAEFAAIVVLVTAR
jgi:F0F1-type ATP synthase membrane subunit c/vacuolar-type H+-ATPase subunit K